MSIGVDPEKNKYPVMTMPTASIVGSRSEAAKSASSNDVRSFTDSPQFMADVVAAASAAMAAINAASPGAKVDDVNVAYKGPYVIDGGNETVYAPVASKLSTTSKEATKAKDLAGVLGDPALAARVQSGQASPADIKAATQKLIDKGKLPEDPYGDSPGRVRAMQQQYGIGVDGAGYTRHAAAAAAGVKSLPVGSDLGMRHLDTNKSFTKVPPGEVQAGDIITLDPKSPGKMGQNVVVRDRHTLADADVHGTMAETSDLDGFFTANQAKGPIQAITVDSSWGDAGQRRDTWLYNESSKQWAHKDPQTSKWSVSSDGPVANDTFHGAYRVK